MTTPSTTTPARPVDGILAKLAGKGVDVSNANSEDHEAQRKALSDEFATNQAALTALKERRAKLKEEYKAELDELEADENILGIRNRQIADELKILDPSHKKFTRKGTRSGGTTRRPL